MSRAYDEVVIWSEDIAYLLRILNLLSRARKAPRVQLSSRVLCDTMSHQPPYKDVNTPRTIDSTDNFVDPQ